MARNYSVQGALSGRLGNMIGYRMFGRNYLRSMPSHYNDRRSDSQLVQRGLFKAMILFAQRANSALRVGLRAEAAARQMTAGNAFLKLNHHNFLMDNGVVNINYSSLRLSAGHVGLVGFGPAVMDDNNIVEVRFEKQLMLPQTRNDDRVHLYLYCPRTGYGCEMQTVERREKKARFLLPGFFAGEEVHVWGFVESLSGECSATAYIGTIDTESPDNQPDEPVNNTKELLPVSELSTPSAPVIILPGGTPRSD